MYGENIAQEEPTNEEQMPSTDLLLSKEKGPEEKMQSAEQAFSEGVVSIPPAGAR